MKRTTIINILTAVAAASSVGSVMAMAIEEAKAAAVLAGVACMILFAVLPALERKGGVL